MSSAVLAYAIVVDDVGLDGIYSATVTCSDGHMHDLKKEIGVEYE